MADTLSTTVMAEFSWSFREGLDLGNVIDSAKLQFSKTLADGTAIDTADKIWHDTRSILTTANDDLDLTALTHSIFGSTVTINLAKVKGILIVNNDTDTGDELVIRADATNGFTGWCNGITTSRLWLGPDSAWLWTSKKDGVATSGTDKVLRINNPNAGTVSYSIAIVGTSA